MAPTDPTTDPSPAAPAAVADAAFPDAARRAPSGASTGRGNAASPAEVGAMFDRIAHRYDLLNAVISGFQEPRWRRRLVAATELRPGMAALDVACGTGAVARDLARRVGPTGRVAGIDISDRMVARAAARRGNPAWLEYRVGDALALPAGNASFDAATIAFGMRNLPDYGRGFFEMARVVRPGGVVACLEIARPRTLVGRAGRIWFDHAVPVIGRLAGGGDAYRYLVDSVRAYPSPEAIAGIMRSAGLVDVHWTPMTFGMVTLHVGRCP